MLPVVKWKVSLPNTIPFSESRCRYFVILFVRNCDVLYLFYFGSLFLSSFLPSITNIFKPYYHTLASASFFHLMSNHFVMQIRTCGCSSFPASLAERRSTSTSGGRWVRTTRPCTGRRPRRPWRCRPWPGRHKPPPQTGRGRPRRPYLPRPSTSSPTCPLPRSPRTTSQ